MGVKYSACNEELDRVYQDALTKPASAAVAVPWLANGKGLLGFGRLGLIGAHDAGAGLAKSGSNYKLYYTRNFAGWWSFEVWSLAKTAFWGALWMTVLHFVMEQYFSMEWEHRYTEAGYESIQLAMSGTAPYKTFFLGVVGFFAFGIRGLFFHRHTKIAVATGSHADVAAASINFAILVLSVAAIIKGFSTIGVSSVITGKGGTFDVAESSLLAALLSMPVDFMAQIWMFFRDGGVLIGLAAVFTALVLLPAGLALAAWVVMMTGLWPMAAKIWLGEIFERHGNNRVVLELCESSGIPEVAAIRSPGVGMALLTYAVVLLVGFITLV